METKLFYGIQSFFKSAGDESCYALCIIKLAEKITGRVIEPLDALTQGIDKLFIFYDKQSTSNPDNFWVKSPAAFLSILIDKKCSVRQESNPLYMPLPDEYIVQRWERKTTGGVIGHFRLPEWDSLINSQTVKFGNLASLRIFKVEG